MARITRRGVLAGGSLALGFGLAGCAAGPRFLSYDGPEVTALVVNKAERRMFALHDRDILRSYRIDLGFAPVGHKQFEGDGKTPEGTYLIDRRNPRSQFHLSLGISYPNAQDVAFARSHGRSPGGEIFIHGTPARHRRAADWTAGCIAIPNPDIELLYAMVKNGTPIRIDP